MKILVVTREVPPVGGGAGHQAFHLAREIRRRGHDVHIVTMHYGDLLFEEEIDGIRITRIDCQRKHQDSSYNLEMLKFVARATPRVRRIIEDEGIDVLHAHAIIPDGTIAVTAARGRVPTVVTAHGSDVPGYNPSTFRLAHRLVAPGWHWTLTRAAALTTPSRFLRDLIRTKRPAQRVYVIPNAMDTDVFGARERDGSFLLLSRLVRRKGFHLFLEALRGIDEPQVVHIGGEGPMLEELKGLAREIPRHRIEFHGWLENGSEPWRRLFESCSYFVFLSAIENFPLSLLEAQLAGLVVLASPIPGNREVLGRQALFTDGLEVPQVESTVRAALALTPEERERLSRASERRVRENFDWAVAGERFESLYRRLIDTRSTDPAR